MDEISRLIAKGDWQAIANQCDPKSLAKELPFEKGRFLAYKMLFNDLQNDNLRDYATQLLEEIRLAYPKLWGKDWRNDIFLGDACYMTMKYNERYKAYKRAYEKAIAPTPSLLISLASCYLSPEPPITLEEAENLAKRALEKELSVEGVVLLKGIYAEKKDQHNFDYWNEILEEVERKQMRTKEDWPNISLSE